MITTCLKYVRVGLVCFSIISVSGCVIEEGSYPMYRDGYRHHRHSDYDHRSHHHYPEHHSHLVPASQPVPPQPMPGPIPAPQQGDNSYNKPMLLGAPPR